MRHLRAAPVLVALSLLSGTARAQVASSIASNFNGTAMAGTSFIWFTSHFKIGGATDPAVGTKLFVAGGKITFVANSLNYILNVPDAEITFGANGSAGSYTYSLGKWLISAPRDFGGDIFMGGLAFDVPSGGLPGGENPVTWSANFGTSSSGMDISW